MNTPAKRKPALDFRPIGAEEFRDKADRLGLTISHSDALPGDRSRLSVARLFGLSPRVARYYATGDRSIPIAIGTLMRLLVEEGYSYADIAGSNAPRR